MHITHKEFSKGGKYIGRLFASAKTIGNNGPDTCVFDRF